MKIAAYCRVSTDQSDQINSLQMQKQFFETYTRQHQHTLVEIYADEGISGTKLKNRKEFLRLMEDAQNGHFEMIVVKDISRFARNTVDFLQSIRALKGWGIETVFLTANMTVLGNSEFVLTIFGALAQEESANTSKRIKFGKKLNAQKGRVPNLVYGYNKERGRPFEMCIHSHQAEMIRRIYNWYEKDGLGAGRIAQQLNEWGETTKRGCKWTQNAICRILTNPLYTGKIINGKEEIEDFLTGKRQAKAQEEWITVLREDLQIISPEQFTRVQNLLQKRREKFKTEKTRQSNRHLMSTLIRCKECGYAFRRWERTYKNTYVWWSCSRGGKSHTFCANSIRIEEDWLCGELERYFLSCFAHRRQAILKIDRKRKKEGSLHKRQDSFDIWKREQEQADRKKERFLDLYAEGILKKEELKQKLDQIAQALEKVEASLKKWDAPEERSTCNQAYSRLEEIVRLKILGNTRLKQIIQTIQVSKEGQINIYFHRFSRQTICNDST